MRSVEVHHELTGASDAPVLLLAGPLGSTLEIWEPQVNVLAERFRVLRYDHRGHGRSPVPTGSYAIADLAIDAAPAPITMITGHGLSGLHQFVGWARPR
jgi:3-oxoadipate enol-lactonase